MIKLRVCVKHLSSHWLYWWLLLMMEINLKQLVNISLYFSLRPSLFLSPSSLSSSLPPPSLPLSLLPLFLSPSSLSSSLPPSLPPSVFICFISFLNFFSLSFLLLFFFFHNTDTMYMYTLNFSPPSPLLLLLSVLGVMLAFTE